MKNARCFFVVLCFCFSVFAADSDSESILSVFSQLQNYTDKFLAKVDYLDSTKQNVNDSVLESVILEDLKPLATDNFLKEWKGRIDSGFVRGCQLMNDEDFFWALPVLPSDYYNFFIKKSSDGLKAEIICNGRTPDIVSAPNDFLGDSGFCCFVIKNPEDKQFAKVQWRNIYSVIFSFKKTSSGWKVSGFNEKVFHLSLAGQ